MIRKLIIFVHGSLLPLLSLKSLIITLQDNTSLQNSKHWFKRYKNALRFNTFYRYQPINGLGLRKISHEENDTESPWTSRFDSAYWYEMLYRTQIPSLEKINFSCYTFGWNGQLSKHKREQAAERFYHDLTTLITQIKHELADKDTLHVTIAAHSHGGNVALNLALIEQRSNQGLSIDELLLFGVPIQSETAAFIHSPVFKKIYHFYSSGDLFQIADIFSSQDWLAQRTFDKNTKALPLPEKLIQIEVKVDKKTPAHAELWFFGAPDNFLYRKNLSIYPLPIIIFTPIITAQINHYWPTTFHVQVALKNEKNIYHFVFYPYDAKLINQKAGTIKDHLFSLDLNHIFNQKNTD